MSEVAALQQLYRTKQEVLIHNDLHGGEAAVQIYRSTDFTQIDLVGIEGP